MRFYAQFGNSTYSSLHSRVSLIPRGKLSWELIASSAIRKCSATSNPRVDLNRNHPRTSGSVDRTAFARFCSKSRSGAGEVDIDKSNLHQKCPGTRPPDGGSMSHETSVEPVVPVALVKCPVVNKAGTCTCSPPEASLHHTTSPRAVLFSSRRRRGPCCWSFTKGGKNRRTTLGF